MSLYSLPWDYDLWRTTEPSYVEEEDDWFEPVAVEEEEEEEI